MTKHTLASFVILSGFLMSLGNPSWAKEVRFVASNSEGERAVWHTDTVMLEQSTDLDEDITFILENPTSVQHAFVMPGAQCVTRERIMTPEQYVDIDEPIRMTNVEPLAVTVKPGESKRIPVHAMGLLTDKSVGKQLRFFCTIHKDLHQAGSIYVM
jgi:hypothetical protein